MKRNDLIKILIAIILSIIYWIFIYLLISYFYSGNLLMFSLINLIIILGLIVYKVYRNKNIKLLFRLNFLLIVSIQYIFIFSYFKRKMEIDVFDFKFSQIYFFELFILTIFHLYAFLYRNKK